MAVVEPREASLECEGIYLEGVKIYPRARPVRMLRIFRRRFSDLVEAEEELRGVKIVESYLAPDYMALSDEFLADLISEGSSEMILCGLQEYVQGEMIDPWGALDDRTIERLLKRLTPCGGFQEGLGRLVKHVRAEAISFAERLKRMAYEAGRIPDLAGVGNLLLTSSGRIKLVDINNISKISIGGVIALDDRGYPVCDKSVEALWRIECFLGGRGPCLGEPLYRAYLDPVRMEEVRALEGLFHSSQTRDAPFTGAQ